MDLVTYTKPRVHVPLRTEGHAVSETARRVSQLTLYPDQVAVLNNPPSSCVFLHGPPGCGKTVMLVLKAIQWLRDGHDVWLISTNEDNLAVSILMEEQIRETLRATAPPAETTAPQVGTLTRHFVDCEATPGMVTVGHMDNLLAWIGDALDRSRNASLHVIMDDVDPACA